jgi:hypothetical protein
MSPPQLPDNTLADIREIVVEAEKKMGVYSLTGRASLRRRYIPLPMMRMIPVMV